MTFLNYYPGVMKRVRAIETRDLKKCPCRRKPVRYRGPLADSFMSRVGGLRKRSTSNDALFEMVTSHWPENPMARNPSPLILGSSGSRT